MAGREVIYGSDGSIVVRSGHHSYQLPPPVFIVQDHAASITMHSLVGIFYSAAASGLDLFDIKYCTLAQQQ